MLGPDDTTTLLAATLGQDTVERCRRVLGPDHHFSLLAAAALTAALTQLGEEAAADVLGQDTVERCRRVLGQDHPTTLFAITVAAAATSATLRHRHQPR